MKKIALILCLAFSSATGLVLPSIAKLSTLTSHKKRRPDLLGWGGHTNF